MSYDQKQVIEQREADEDELYALFYGYADIQPMVNKICNHMLTLDLNSRYKTIIENVMNKNDRIPKLATIIFAIWLFPELRLAATPSQDASSLLNENIQSICMNILEGRHLSVQEFVGSALTDYIVNPKET